jgi:hypothetical protein
MKCFLLFASNQAQFLVIIYKIHKIMSAKLRSAYQLNNMMTFYFCFDNKELYFVPVASPPSVPASLSPDSNITSSTKGTINVFLLGI